MSISIIVAVAENGVIGRRGGLPWRLSADLRRFKRLTMGHAIIMGRKTWESIGRPLPGRQMVVVTRQPDYRAEGVTVAPDLPSALEKAGDPDGDEVFVIGGAEIYRQALPLATWLYLTRVAAEVDGDTFFPKLAMDQWEHVSTESHPADEKNDFPHSFEVYERV